MARIKENVERFPKVIEEKLERLKKKLEKAPDEKAIMSGSSLSATAPCLGSFIGLALCEKGSSAVSVAPRLGDESADVFKAGIGGIFNGSGLSCSASNTICSIGFSASADGSTAFSLAENTYHQEKAKLQERANTTNSKKKDSTESLNKLKRRVLERTLTDGIEKSI